jgi:hypothetical protein
MYPVSLISGAADGGNIQDLSGMSWPAGIRAADTAVLLWSQQNTFTYTGLAGFTEVDTQINGSLQMRLGLRICDGAESGTITLSSSGINRQSCAMAIYRGLDPVAPLAAYSFLAETVSGTTHACPAVAAPAADADTVIVTGIGERGSTGTSGWTPPTAYTERGDSGSLGRGSGGTITGIADDGLTSARPGGATVTPANWTSTNAFATAITITWSLALRRTRRAGWGVPL